MDGLDDMGSMGNRNQNNDDDDDLDKKMGTLDLDDDAGGMFDFES
jgi:hypothetical protein